MNLVIASNNTNKIREIKEIIGDFFTDIKSLKELGVEAEVEETGTTFLENALIKAREISRLTNSCALADDSGLCVNALNGAPGVYSARYAGDGHDDKANNELLLKNMSGFSDRSAYFISTIALVCPDGKEITAEGRVYGRILTAPDGDYGFGYDPLFFSEELNKSFGRALPEEKNAISHRARALNALKQKLSDKLF